MAVRYERPYSHSAAWASRIGLLAVLLFLFAAIGQRLGTIETPNFVAIALTAVAFAFVALVLGVAGLSSLWISGAKGGRSAFWGLMLGLCLVVPFGLAVMLYVQKPRLHDISTDVISPPALLVEPAVDRGWLGQPQALGAQARERQREAYPELTGRRYEGAIDRVLAAVQTVTEARGIAIVETEGVAPAPPPIEPLPDTPEIAEGTVPPPADPFDFDPPVPVAAPRGPVAPDQGDGPTRAVLQGEASSPLLGLKSDVVIRLIEEEETTFVDMRSVSRYGDHDLGLNAWLIQRFLRELDAQLLGVASQ
ncbi:DUF1499 domain-containing protein [Pararhizobium haloflavum]|uniref:DUF1499 domain-containing protein n=1 Tax=Pararhizobium haloflavum TaxID=2037914 RepID=UPI000C1A4280|nr:DUF1499 domain-containing protein [Pararhizobium haloflavum]